MVCNEHTKCSPFCFLERLVAPLPPGVGDAAEASCVDLIIEQTSEFLDRAGILSPVTVTEEVVRTESRLLVAAVRSPLNNTLAGELLDWKVLATGPPPYHTRRITYKSALPFPFSCRTFNLESWFLPSTALPPSLRERGVLCFLSQTPDDDTVTEGVEGNVIFSGYLFVPLKAFERGYDALPSS